jgi:hypothetical protein
VLRSAIVLGLSLVQPMGNPDDADGRSGVVRTGKALNLQFDLPSRDVLAGGVEGGEVQDEGAVFDVVQDRQCAQAAATSIGQDALEA